MLNWLFLLSSEYITPGLYGRGTHRQGNEKLRELFTDGCTIRRTHTTLRLPCISPGTDVVELTNIFITKLLKCHLNVTPLFTLAYISVVDIHTAFESQPSALGNKISSPLNLVILSAHGQRTPTTWNISQLTRVRSSRQRSNFKVEEVFLEWYVSEHSDCLYRCLQW